MERECLFQGEISLDIGKVISEVGVWANVGESDVSEWKLAWRRELFVWKNEQYGQLITLMSTTRWNRGNKDRRI